MRYTLFAFWCAITFVWMCIVLSDFVFNRISVGLFAARLALVLIWPLAILSSAGRNVLFKEGMHL
jgi:hypothetical protein